MKGIYLKIDPTSPLVFRSGKPFGIGGHDVARYPWPSAIAGSLRTHWMITNGDPTFSRPQDALAKKVAGPFLLGPSIANKNGAPQDLKGSISLYCPKPADALIFLDEEAQQNNVCRLLPGQFPENTGSNFPEGIRPVVLPEGTAEAKPRKSASFWPLSLLHEWDHGKDIKSWDCLNEDPAPMRNRHFRTHVRIDPNTHAIEDGKLFQVEGLDFGQTRLSEHGFSGERWALGARFSDPLDIGLIHLGGERRTAWLSPVDDKIFDMPEDLSKEMSTSGRIALTMMTPALFDDGWKPRWLREQLDVPGIPGLKLKLVAAALERWQGISGWDIANQKPKRTRKVVPAGSTYWFRILQRPDGPDWPKRLWLASVCDRTQDRLDGWGIVVPRIGKSIDYPE